MLFQELNKLKRRSIMTSIVLLAIGLIILLCPAIYISMLIDAIGMVVLVVAFVLIFDFVGSKKSLMNFVFLTLALALLIVGALIMVFDLKTVGVIAWIAGLALIIVGLYNIFGAVVFARRSGRKGWGIMVFLAVIMIFLGVIIIVNPWWDTPEALMNFIGLITIYVAIASAVRLIWLWPIKSA